MNKIWEQFSQGGLAAITQNDLNLQRELTIVISIQESHCQILKEQLKDAQNHLDTLKQKCAHLTYDGKSAFTVPTLNNETLCSICGGSK